jgi:hypothetical protein
MSTPFRNVHVYDGKLQGMYDEQMKYSDGQKVTIFRSFCMILSNPVAIKCVNMIEQDINGSQNYDNSNKIDASNLLASVLTMRSMTKDILNIIEEQLVDIYNLGRCPQGRVTRLMQMYSLLKDL